MDTDDISATRSRHNIIPLGDIPDILSECDTIIHEGWLLKIPKPVIFKMKIGKYTLRVEGPDPSFRHIHSGLTFGKRNPNFSLDDAFCEATGMATAANPVDRKFSLHTMGMDSNGHPLAVAERASRVGMFPFESTSADNLRDASGHQGLVLGVHDIGYIDNLWQRGKMIAEMAAIVNVWAPAYKVPVGTIIDDAADLVFNRIPFIGAHLAIMIKRYDPLKAIPIVNRHSEYEADIEERVTNSNAPPTDILEHVFGIPARQIIAEKGFDMPGYRASYLDMLMQMNEEELDRFAHAARQAWGETVGFSWHDDETVAETVINQPVDMPLPPRRPLHWARRRLTIECGDTTSACVAA